MRTMVTMARRVRPLLWVASSKRDYLRFPPRVQDQFGFELFLAQTGQHPPSAKPLKGLGSGTVELVDDFDGDTYRAVYTVATPSMFCTRSRRSRSRASRRRKATSTW
jgi:phage-related protein